MPTSRSSGRRLRYLPDDRPGIRRRRRGRGFEYRDPQGRRVDDPATLARIRSLAVPPAWRDVWISPSPHGHLQATGRDARGRKQYRYHREWVERREEDKFGRLAAFGDALPRLRRRVRADLRRDDLPREKVVAAVVALLDRTHARVGNDEYARANGSFGLTTLMPRHVRVGRRSLELDFRGKSGARQHLRLDDRRLAAIVRRCRELPGHRLFQYVDERGQRHNVDSGDVNGYLRKAGAGDWSAKEFRTWHASVRALAELRRRGGPPNRVRVAGVVERIAAELGNTRAVCRKYYVHPEVVAAYLELRLGERPARGRDGLGGQELDLLLLLRRARRR